MKRQCPICLEGDLAEIRSITSPYTAHDYKLYECRSCQSRSFDLDEHRDVDLSHHYDERSADQAYLKRAFTVSKYWAAEVKTVKTIYGGLPRSVLDIGCRTGDFLLHWPPEVDRVGVEVSKHSAAVAAERGLAVRQGFVEEIESAAKFDVVTGYAILEHLARPQEFLGKIANLMNERGVLVIMIPSYQTLKAQLLETLHIRWHMYSPPEHLSLYSRKFLDSYLAARGFRLLKRRYTSGGMFNPFKRIPLASGAFSRVMHSVDTQSPLNRFPIFDHMYSYYGFAK